VSNGDSRVAAGGEVRVRRAGFTLIEVLVALLLSGAVLLGARAVLEGLADQSVRIERKASEVDDVANAEMILRSAVSQLEIARDEPESFVGGEREARFATWCAVPAGWQERCHAALGITPDGAALSLTLRTQQSSGVMVRRPGRFVTLRYLVSAANGGEWVRRWGRGVTAPLAIGVITARDTLILRIGQRG
jgi:prepilin-type N-terminal cleavage/methylation domain-containing protein